MIKKNSKKFIAIILLVISIFTLTACGSEKASQDNSKESQSETMARIKESGKLVLGTCADFPPYEFHKSVDGKDTIVGFDIEIGKEIAKDLGVELEIKDMKFDGLLASLDQRKIDLVISGMTPTEDRKKNVDFSDIYYKSVQTIVIREEDKDKYKTTTDFDDKKIGVQKGSIQEGIATDQVSGAKQVGLGKISDLILSLKSNRIDGAIMELPVATSYVKANSDLIISDVNLNSEESGSAVAFKKGSSDLVEMVNKTLDRLNKDKTIDKFVTDANNLVE